MRLNRVRSANSINWNEYTTSMRGLLPAFCSSVFRSSPPTLQWTRQRSTVPPGAEVSDAKRLFQGIPGIERAPGGRLWAVWYSGDKREGPQNYVVLTTSGDGGKSWSGPRLVIDPPGFVRAFDACLWLDQKDACGYFGPKLPDTGMDAAVCGHRTRPRPIGRTQPGLNRAAFPMACS